MTRARKIGSSVYVDTWQITSERTGQSIVLAVMHSLGWWTAVYEGAIYQARALDDVLKSAAAYTVAPRGEALEIEESDHTTVT